MSVAGGHSSIISCVRVGKHPNTRSKNHASAQVFCCECGLICLRVRTNSLICDVNLIIFGGKLIKLRRKFNNLRRKLKNYSALAAKLLRTRKVFTPHSQQNFSALAAKHNQARAILNIESDVQLSLPSFITSITQNKSICAFLPFPSCISE